MKLQERSLRLQDVADHAGVSLAAASRILRGDSTRFREDTRRRVEASAEKLGWRRNLLVTGMQTGRTKTVAVVIPPYDSFWVAVLSGIHSLLAEHDYLPITVWSGDIRRMPQFEANEEQGISLMNRLLDRRVDGFILWPPFGLAYYQRARELRDRTVPVVMIDYRTAQPICDTVATSETQAMETVASHLLALGHRRIAYIGCREADSQAWALERRRGFESALSRAGGVEYRNWKLNSQGSDGVDVARTLLRSRLKPTAVVAATDHQAACVYLAAAELGLQVPQDVSVVGFADLDFAATLKPGLTTVRQRAFDIGVRSASLLLERIASKQTAASFLDARVDADFIQRNSTATANPLR